MRNPLEPRKPDAPVWDPNATARGVYLTDLFEVAVDYAALISEDDGSSALVVGVDTTGLRRIPDPQVIDLIQEPYDEYRSMVLDWIREEHRQRRSDMKDQGLSKEEIRATLGTFYDFANQMLLTRFNQFRAVEPRYPSAKQHYSAKVMAANAILSREEAWHPLALFHQVYGDKMWAPLWAWLNWQESDEDSEYSGQRYFASLQPSRIPDDIILAAGHMFYLEQEVHLDRITRVFRWDDAAQTSEIIWNNYATTNEVYHGTSSKRWNQAFPNLQLG